MSEFVSSEIAHKLKEKGYPQLKKGTLAMYNEVGEWFSLARYLDEYEYCFDDFDEHDCVAPTISQVLEWLRKEKSIIYLPHIEPIEEKLFFYVVKLPQASDFPEYLSSVIYNTYEEAALAGIEWVLNNLI